MLLFRILSLKLKDFRLPLFTKENLIIFILRLEWQSKEPLEFMLLAGGFLASAYISRIRVILGLSLQHAAFYTTCVLI